jgi:F0F1-type ATP synthase epsilon subunit
MFIDLFTPSGVLIKDLACNEVTLPLASGEVTILTNHEKFLGILGTGIVHIKPDPQAQSQTSSQTQTDQKAQGKGQQIIRVVVTHGLCKIDDNKIILLATTAEASGDVNLDRAKIALKKSQDQLAQSQQLDSQQIIKYQRKLARAEARIRMAYLRE